MIFPLQVGLCISLNLLFIWFIPSVYYCVVAYFNDFGDSFIVKSSDNGTTWNRTNFLDFPKDKYAADDGLDLDSNGVFDMVYSTDNYGTVILDGNNLLS